MSVVDQSPEMSQVRLRVKLPNKSGLVQCQIRLNDATSTSCPFLTMDLIFTTISVLPQTKTPEHYTEVEVEVDDPSLKEEWSQLRHCGLGAIPFFKRCLQSNVDRLGHRYTAMKIILASKQGYIVRRDIIQRRFLGYDFISEVLDFNSPQKQVKPFDAACGYDLPEALGQAVGAILVKDLPTLDILLVTSALARLESEVEARLSFPWIVDTPPLKKRLAVVEGRPNPSSSAASEGIFRAAAALDIDLVIIDEEGHWLQDRRNSHLRDEFIACDLSCDEYLPGRICEALAETEGPVHGIITFADRLLSATAKAAEMLDLWTNPSNLIEICSDKQKTREKTGLSVLCTTGALELSRQLRAMTSPITYPVIIKPSKGNSSEGVSKAVSEIELFEAVDRVERMFPGRSILVEPYISGPEVDANFVLLDGELVFSDINDDFPSPAEMEGSFASSSFAEMSTIMPSQLPESELSLLTSSLKETLIGLGFQSGMFHVEARIKDSRVRYEADKDKGIELAPYSASSGTLPEPSCFLIEINARTPGHQESFAVEYTYGVDYYCFYMLMAVSPPQNASTKRTDYEHSRINALSHPFPPHIRHPTNIVFVPATRGGRFLSSKELPPMLMNRIPHHRVLMAKDQVIGNPEVESKWPFIAYFLVVSNLVGRAGRDQVRALGNIVRKSFEYELGA